MQLYYYTTILLLHSFNGLFSRTTQISRHQKDKPFWILMKQEMTGWQWHQLDHMQVICTLPQTDNHASTSPLSFLQTGCPSYCPTNNIKNSPDRGLRSFPDLDLTSDDLESHIVVNVSSTSNIVPSFIKIGRKRFFGKV